MNRFAASILAFLFPAVLAPAQSPAPKPDGDEAGRLTEAQQWISQAAAAYAQNDFAKSAELYQRAYQAGATTPAVPYNLACSLARSGKTDDSFRYLDEAVGRGWRDVDHLKKDADLEPLRADSRWEPLVQRCAAKREEFRKSLGNPDLYEDLMKRMRTDQDARLAAVPNALEIIRIDAENTAWMKNVIEKHGWPGRSMVGPDGAQAAWLLVQHADQDRDFQRACLDLLNKAHEKGEVSGQHVAYLTDRVLVADGKPQLYGTQFHTVDGKLVPQPIENEAEVDQRRAKVGLGTLAEYAQQMRSQYRK